jgi:hypothetical protein
MDYLCNNISSDQLALSKIILAKSRAVCSIGRIMIEYNLIQLYEYYQLDHMNDSFKNKYRLIIDGFFETSY